MLELDTTFADNNGFASGTPAVDYALGNTTTPVELPGGLVVQSKTDIIGRASYTDIDVRDKGFGFNTGKVTKLVCIQFIAKETGTAKLAYRMRDLCDMDMVTSYVDDTTYQAKNGAKVAYMVK